MVEKNKNPYATNEANVIVKTKLQTQPKESRIQGDDLRVRKG